MNVSIVRRVLLGVAAPVVSVVVALAISSIVLELSGSDAYQTFKTMITNGTKLESIVDMLNRATPLYLSGVAAAIGFRMNLFNIGVEGQYILAAFVAAVVGAQPSASRSSTARSPSAILKRGLGGAALAGALAGGASAPARFRIHSVW